MRKIKVVLAQYPLECHSRGIITVARILRDAGFEVVMAGNLLPDDIVSVALQEDADVIGMSTYCGGELCQSVDLIRAADKAGIAERTVFVLGGVFSKKSGARLLELGFSGVFPPSSSREEIVSCLKASIESKLAAVQI